MPSLARLLRNLIILAALGWLALWAMATYIQPSPRTISIDVPIASEQ
jgi:hypothetical protein